MAMNSKSNGFPPQNKRFVLLCVAGMTPQIVTETLYALTQERGERVDEIRVITTLGGKHEIEDKLLGRDGHFNRFCREFGIDRKQVRFDESTIILLRRPDGENLEDIRTAEENEIAGNQISDIVRELCRDPQTRLHASVAGGRKTMGIYLAAAMSLYGRADDSMSHVLVSEQFETHPEFFYKPRKPKKLQRKGVAISTASAEIYLADIPFVRLRGLHNAFYESRPLRFSDAVADAQSQLRLLESNYALQIDLANGKLLLGNREIELSDREFFVYALFAQLRQRAGATILAVSPDKIPARDFDFVCKLISSGRGDGELGLDEFGGLRRGEFLRSLCHDLYSKANPRLSIAESRADVCKTMGEIKSRINRKIKAARIPKDFEITNVNHGNRRRQPEFLIPAEPQRLQFG